MPHFIRPNGMHISCLRKLLNPKLPMLRITVATGQGGPRGGIKSLSDLVKPKFLNKRIKIPLANRTKIVRFFMGIFKQKKYNYREISRIRRFLRRFHLSNAEIHAVVFSLGYQYSSNVTGNLNLRHLKLNGYLDDKPKRRKK